MNTWNEGHQLVLQRFAAACEKDERVLAAFLGGSLAAGTADEWSDLDIYLVTTDEGYNEAVAELRTFIHQLGQPIFLENFDILHVLFFIFADSTEGELHFGRESGFLDMHKGPYKVLLDKKGILEGVAFPGYSASHDEQTETLRRQIYGFWHDLSHFVTAMGRGQLWWAQGQLEALRGYCVSICRLKENFTDSGDVVSEPYFKVEQAIPASQLAPLRNTFAPMEAGAMLQNVYKIVDFYSELAPALAKSHGISYPVDLERVVVSRLERLQSAIK